MNTGISAINDEVQKASAFVRPLFNEIGKVVIGQNYLVFRVKEFVVFEIGADKDLSPGLFGGLQQEAPRPTAHRNPLDFREAKRSMSNATRLHNLFNFI